MIKHSTALLTQMSQSQLTELTTIIEETVVLSAFTTQRVFTSADLWHIQRSKQRVQRRLA